jgi:molybdopterin molybdotransferase
VTAVQTWDQCGSVRTVPADLIDIETARRTVLGAVRPLEAEELPLREALGRVLATDVKAAAAIPPFDNSAMDGYAVRSLDTAGASPARPLRLAVIDESRAGSPAAAGARPGEAIAISTGAMLPRGCDAVVRVEDTVPVDGAIEVRAAIEPGSDVRRAGDDVGSGELVLRSGTVLGPAELGVMASLGEASARCAQRSRVGVLTTGDELIEPGTELGPGDIHDANAYSVPALAVAAGGEITSVEHVGDDEHATRVAIGDLLQADVAVICGGVSVGEHDHVRPALDGLGVRERFWGVALRPGRPTWFGVTGDGSLVFGLPGNPVSAMVTFLLLVRPALLALAGADPAAARLTATLDEPYPKRPGRAHAARVRLELRDDGWHARLTKEQGSHVLTSMLGADGLAFIPTDSGDVPAGRPVEVELLREPV